MHTPLEPIFSQRNKNMHLLTRKRKKAQAPRSAPYELELSLRDKGILNIKIIYFLTWEQKKPPLK